MNFGRKKPEAEMPLIKLPMRAQDVILLRKIWSDGICEYAGVYSKVFKFLDINYQDLSEEGQENIFKQYMKILSGFDINVKVKVTIHNHRRNMKVFREKTLYKEKEDKLNTLRNEINQIIETSITESNNIERERYITVSVAKKDIVAARAFFSRVETLLAGNFSTIGSEAEPLDAADRLKIYYTFFRPEEVENYDFNFINTVKKGHDFKDYICPGAFKFRGLYNHFRYGERYGRVLYLKEYATYMKDGFINKLCELNSEMMLSIDYVKVPKDEAVGIAQESMSKVEYNIRQWQKRQNKNQNYAAELPYEYELQRKEAKEFFDDLTERDLDMMQAVITMVITADSLEKLNEDTEIILTKARENTCQVETLYCQQLEGLQTVLPFGIQRIEDYRTLTTEALAVFMPFKTVELNQEGGSYIGKNKLSGNIVRVNRKKSNNGNKIVLGGSGAGKSMAEKFEKICQYLSDEKACHILIDPDGEYAEIVNALSGTVYNLSDTSDNHLNAMAISELYDGGKDPIVPKTNFIMDLVKEIMGQDNVTSGHMSIVSRCCKKLYSDYISEGYIGPELTMKDLRQEVMKQSEAEASEIALALELFTEGTLNVFSHQTNVDLNKRVICFDIHEMSENLRKIAMLIIMDFISSKVAQNRAAGIETFVDIDELYLMFKEEKTAEFFYKLWKRIRKMGGFCTGLTQDVEDLLISNTGRSMVANSEQLVLFNLQYKNRVEVAKLRGLSENQLKYITNVKPGEGLLISGKYIVPFKNDIPKNTELYRLINTDFKVRESDDLLAG